MRRFIKRIRRRPEQPLPLWGNRDYLLLWSGQTVSAIGSQASQLSLPLLILKFTGSPAQAGLLGALRGFAYLAFGLPAGALIDRWDRRQVMLLCESVRALVFCSIPIALLVGRTSALQLYGVSLVEAILFIFFGLAETACLTSVVSAAQLPEAISQSQATDAAAALGGPPLGGALFGIAPALPFLADAVSYAASALSILLIRTPLVERPKGQVRHLRAEIGEAGDWIRRRPVLFFLLWFLFCANIVYGGWPLLLIELARRLGGSSGIIGLLFASGGAGTILGALITPSLQRRLSIGAIVIGVAWFFALTWPPYALAPNLLVLGIVNFAGFLFVPLLFGTMISYRLLLVSDELQARVNSIFRVAAFGAQALGFLLTGLLLQRWGPVATVWATSVPAFVLALSAMLSAPLRHTGRLSPAGGVDGD